MADYLLDNAWHQAHRRLSLLEQVYDPGSIYYLERLGIAAGWHCWEVGAGAGSLAVWLCQRVGPRGAVLATDIDTRFLRALDCPRLEVRQHDLLTDPVEQAAFDLVHVRFLLHHLPDRQAALARLLAALKPGGRLLVEEADNGVHLTDPRCGHAASVLLDKVATGMHTLLQGRGGEYDYGRQLYRALQDAGLAAVQAEGRVQVLAGGTAAAELFRLSFLQVREPLVGTGALTTAELDDLLAWLERPEFVALFGCVVAAWGRRTAR